MVTIEDRGFKMWIPDGWKLNINHYGASLFVEPDNQKNREYKRNIQVMAFSGSLFIDELELSSFSDEIKANAEKMSNAISNYNITDRMIIDMPDGSEGMLFYARFDYASESMMQMHLVVSSATDHFIMVYTDLERFFDFDNGLMLDEAFTVMQSAQLSDPAPKRSFYFYIIFGSLFILAFLGWSYKSIRAYFSRRLLAEYAEEMGEDDPGKSFGDVDPTNRTSIEIDNAVAESAYSRLKSSQKSSLSFFRRKNVKASRSSNHAWDSDEEDDDDALISLNEDESNVDDADAKMTKW